MCILICLRCHHSLLSPVQLECHLPLITVTFYFSYSWELYSYIHVSVKKKCWHERQKGLSIMIYFLETTENYLFNMRAECISIRFVVVYFILSWLLSLMLFLWAHVGFLFTPSLPLSSTSWKCCEIEWFLVDAPYVFYFNV